jgi:hypothetical protein
MTGIRVTLSQRSRPVGILFSRRKRFKEIPSARVVAALYQSILGRNPEPEGEAWWVSQLQAGVSSLEIVQRIWESPEHRGIQVDSFYATYLHRDADPAGRAFWVNALEAGMTENDVIRGFLTSPEYTLAHLDTEPFIRGLYADVLGRDVQATELAGWELISEIPGGRSGVIEGILSSNEAYRRIVDNDYLDLLGRQADPSGEQFWLDALASSKASPSVVAEAFLASDEYFAGLNGSAHN